MCVLESLFACVLPASPSRSLQLGALFVVLAAVSQPINLLDVNFNVVVGQLILTVEHVKLKE